MEYTILTQKGVTWECICEDGRQEITENLYNTYLLHRRPALKPEPENA
jgi:hypothetical protein